MMDVMPTPPGFLAGVDLKGPYDADIPQAKVNQIKSAGLMADWAVPYIFLSVACRFESDGDEKRSIVFYDRAITEFRKRNNVFGEGTSWSRKIAALQRFGHDTDVLQSIRDLEVKASGGPLSAFVSYTFGRYYAHSGNYIKALEYFEQAREANKDYAGNPDLTALRRDTELAHGMTLILADYFPAVAGRIFLADFDETFYRDIRRRVSTSLSYLERAQHLSSDLSQTAVIRYFPEITPSHMECDIQNYLGLAFGIQGQSDKALYHLEKAGTMTRLAGYHLGKADGVFFQNQIYLLNKNTSAGKQAAYGLENIADQYHLLPYAIWSKIIRAHHERQSGDGDLALKSIHEYLDLMEKNDSWLSRFSDFRGTGYFKPQSVYDAVFDLYISRGDVQNAFKTAERIKATPLAETFKTAIFAENSVEGQLIDKLRSDRENAARTYRRLLSPANASTVFLKTAQLAGRLQKDALNVLSVMKNQHEALYSLTRVDPPDAKEIQKQLDQNTTLFSYYSTAQFLYVWVISQNGIHMEKIKISRADVDKFVRDYHQTLMLKDKSQIDAMAEKAYDAFLKPVIPFVHGDRVGFIPHGALYQFPFASMRYMKSYLVDVFSIFYLPHSGMMNQPWVKMASPVPKKSLIIARSKSGREDSTVPIDTEFETLRRIYPRADYFVQFENPRDALLKLSGEYDIIHFAVECYLKDSAPLGSGFLVSSAAKRGGYLTISDLLGLSVKGRASVISACLTENGLPSTGSAAFTLAGSLLYDTTPLVVMPLWTVDQKARTAFTEIFHKILEKNDDVADSLRAAQNEMIQAGFSPADWGAFILIGRH